MFKQKLKSVTVNLMRIIDIEKQKKIYQMTWNRLQHSNKYNNLIINKAHVIMTDI